VSRAWKPTTDTLLYRGSPAGGGYSTVGDLLRFANALQSNLLLNAHYTELTTTRKVDGDDGAYGYGFSVEKIAGTRCYGHNGGGPGQNGDLLICPKLGYVVTALANMDPLSATSIRNFITNRIGPTR